jgi:hypothetical protein
MTDKEQAPDKPTPLILTPTGVEATTELSDPRVILEKHGPDRTPLGTDVYYQGDRAASSELTEDGRLASTASSKASPGTGNEGWVVDTLKERLSRDLGPTSLVAGAEDSAGEDRLLRLPNDRVIVVQVITARTNPGHWREAKAQGTATRASAPEEIAHELRDAITRKVGKSTPVDRASMILALDAQFSPEAAYEAVIRAYLLAYGSPESELGFFQVWVVAPTVEACSRLHDAT